MVTTVTDYHKTLNDLPQGIEGATVKLSPSTNTVPFYFNVVTGNIFHGKTNPFTKGLTSTSLDGGVIFFNLMPQPFLYEITAEKPGVTFSKAYFICRKGAFINLSPPNGPSVITAR